MTSTAPLPIDSSSPLDADTLIVGAGLAGAASAWHLRRAGQQVLVLDAKQTGTRATGVGGGMANPMMAMKGRPTWNARSSLADLEAMGIRTEGSAIPGLGALESAILRPARDEEQAEAFRSQAREHPDLGHFLESSECGPLNDWMESPYGVLLVLRGASLDLGAVAQEWLSDTPVQTITPDWTAVEDREGVRLISGDRHYRARRLLLCMGYGMVTHPLTRTLKLHGIKGQIIRIEKPDGLPDPLPPISSWAYFVDAGDGSLWVGSTFERDWKEEGPTEEATRSLMERAVKVIPALDGARVLEARTGFRVTVPGTRRPMAGPLHAGSRIHVLTGLGARGLLHSAWFGARIPAFFNDPEAIPAECRVVHRSAES